MRHISYEELLGQRGAKFGKVLDMARVEVIQLAGASQCSVSSAKLSSGVICSRVINHPLSQLREGMAINIVHKSVNFYVLT